MRTDKMFAKKTGKHVAGEPRRKPGIQYNASKGKSFKNMPSTMPNALQDNDSIDSRKRVHSV